MPEQTVPETAAREAAVQAVRLAFMVLAGAVAVITVMAQRSASDPDLMRQLRMRWYKASERADARLAANAWARAERARLAYERESGSC
jgi:hypothetical protein